MRSSWNCVGVLNGLQRRGENQLVDLIGSQVVSVESRSPIAAGCEHESKPSDDPELAFATRGSIVGSSSTFIEGVIGWHDRFAALGRDVIADSRRVTARTGSGRPRYRCWVR
jgi:hypothetical protein